MKNIVFSLIVWMLLSANAAWSVQPIEGTEPDAPHAAATSSIVPLSATSSASPSCAHPESGELHQLAQCSDNIEIGFLTTFESRQESGLYRASYHTLFNVTKMLEAAPKEPNFVHLKNVRDAREEMAFKLNLGCQSQLHHLSLDELVEHLQGAVKKVKPSKSTGDALFNKKTVVFKNTHTPLPPLESRHIEAIHIFYKKDLPVRFAPSFYQFTAPKLIYLTMHCDNQFTVFPKVYEGWTHFKRDVAKFELKLTRSHLTHIPRWAMTIKGSFPENGPLSIIRSFKDGENPWGILKVEPYRAQLTLDSNPVKTPDAKTGSHLAWPSMGTPYIEGCDPVNGTIVSLTSIIKEAAIPERTLKLNFVFPQEPDQIFCVQQTITSTPICGFEHPKQCQTCGCVSESDDPETDKIVNFRTEEAAPDFYKMRLTWTHILSDGSLDQKPFFEMDNVYVHDAIGCVTYTLNENNCTNFLLNALSFRAYEDFIEKLSTFKTT